MMKVVLVDDEQLALNILERRLREVGGLRVVGKYTNPIHALEMAPQDMPDIVFLDIGMPELSGIELAERYQEYIPTVQVVFVTAYGEYAVKAFELNALDYIVKPLQRDRLSKTMGRLKREWSDSASAAQPESGSVMIHCFQSLQIERDGHSLETIHWRTFKAQEIFAYLLHFRGQDVRKDVLIDLFWPETDWKKGFTQLYTTVYQIRKTLRSIGLNIEVKSRGEDYVLDLNGITVDVDEWERGVRSASRVTAETLPEHQRLMELYRGDYLAEYGYLWAESERERLRALWFHHAELIGDYLMSEGMHVEGLQFYNRVQLLQPYAENSYFNLMKIYDVLGDRQSVHQQYQRLEQMLYELGLAPKSHIQSWYNSWKAKN